LKENMVELDSKVETLGVLPTKGLKEGPYMFERNGTYYLTYPHVENKIERLEYATSDKPLGPFKITGVIMDESASNCWTNHQSIIQFKGQHYLFYHDRDYSPNFDKARSVRMDSLFFNADGTIKKVMPTLRGAGVTDATKQIQIDRYSEKSAEGVAIDFLDTTNRFLGWKTSFTKENAWIQYNSVDFSKKKFKTVNAKAISPTGGTLQLRLDNIGSPVIGEIKIPAGNKWSSVKATIPQVKPGIHHLFISSKDGKQVEVDWINFE